MRVNLKAIGGLCLAPVTVPALADKVIGVQDGDTLTVLHDKNSVRIHLVDVDAPEK